MRCPKCGHETRVELGTLTKRQAEVYLYVYEFAAREGFAPSFDEIASHFALASTATVHEHLGNLERKGLIQRNYNEARAIRCMVHPDELARGPVPSPTIEVEK